MLSKPNHVAKGIKETHMVTQYYDLIRKKAVHNKEGLGKTQDRSIKSDEIPARVSLTPHGCRTGFNFI